MLAWFSQKFAVEVNPLVQKAEEILPELIVELVAFQGVLIWQRKLLPEKLLLMPRPAGAKVWAELSALVGKEVDSHREAQKAVLSVKGQEK